MKSTATTLAQWIDLRFPCILLVPMLFLYFFTFLTECHGPRVIVSDGDGYYAYLPALFIHRDLSFETAYALFQSGDIPGINGISRNPESGALLNKYNAGVAFMMAPFFLIAHAFTWMMRSPPGGFDWWKLNYPLDGYSLFYQHAAGLGGLFIAFAGLLVLRAELRRVFPGWVANIVVALMLWGTNLLVYGTFWAHSSHSYSLLLFALFLRYTRIWWLSPKTRYAIFLGLILGLIIFVRLNNIVFAITFPLYGITDRASIQARFHLLRRYFMQLIWVPLIAGIVFFPQMLYWRHATGSLLLYSYGDEGFNFLRPAIIQTLFSFRGGLLFWTPILALVPLGIKSCRRLAPDYWLPFLVYIPLQVYMIAAWHDWAFGGGFGHRGFVESYALMAFPLGALFASVRGRWQWICLIAFCLFGVWWNLFFLKLFSTREVSYFGLDWPAFFDIFWSRKEAILSWWAAIS